MEITFDWRVDVNLSDQSFAEKKIKEALLEAKPKDFEPCHKGNLVASFLSSPHPLNNYLEGNIQCSCGKTIATFFLSEPFYKTIKLRPA
jgi:hypothetical protein